MPKESGFGVRGRFWSIKAKCFLHILRLSILPTKRESELTAHWLTCFDQWVRSCAQSTAFVRTFIGCCVHHTHPQRAENACFVIVHASGMTLSSRCQRWRRACVRVFFFLGTGDVTWKTNSVSDWRKRRRRRRWEEDHSVPDGERLLLQQKGLEGPPYTTALRTHTHTQPCGFGGNSYRSQLMVPPKRAQHLPA